MGTYRNWSGNHGVFTGLHLDLSMYSSYLAYGFYWIPNNKSRGAFDSFTWPFFLPICCITQSSDAGLCIILLHLALPSSVDISRRPAPFWRNTEEGRREGKTAWEEGWRSGVRIYCIRGKIKYCIRAPEH